MGVGVCWGWAYRLQGWFVRRMKSEERRVEEKEDIGVVIFVLVIAVKEGKRGIEVVTEKSPCRKKSAKVL